MKDNPKGVDHRSLQQELLDVNMHLNHNPSCLNISTNVKCIITHLYCEVVCDSVCLFVPSYLHQFRMGGVEIL